MDLFVKEALLALLVGTTHYVDTGKPETAIIYHAEDRTAGMRLPDGRTFEGRWSPTAQGYDVSWTDGPSGEWRIARTDDARFVYLDVDGNERGTITQIVPGDAEGFSR